MCVWVCVVCVGVKVCLVRGCGCGCVHIMSVCTCVCGSAGILCGECRREDEGVSALLNECVDCSDASGLLILVLSQSKFLLFHFYQAKYM